MAIDDFVKFRKQVEALKEQALDFVEDEATAFYILTVAAEEIKMDHLADIDDELEEYYEENGDDSEDEDDDEEDIEAEEVENDKVIQEQQGFKVKRPSMVLKGDDKHDKRSDSKTDSK